MKKNNKLILCALSIGLGICAMHLGFASTTTNKKIHLINQKIQSTQSHLNYYKKHQYALENNLKDIELHIARLKVKSFHIRHALSISNKNIKTLKANIEQAKVDLYQKQQTLSTLLKTEYQLKKRSTLQIALSNQSQADKMRLTAYLKYINQYQVNLTKVIRDKVDSLNHNQHNLTLAIANYKTALSKNHKTQLMLETSIKHRLSIVKSMSHKIETHAKRLALLITQKQTLLSAINQANKDVPVSEHLTFAFNFIKPMPWPTHGRFKQRFGTRVDHSQLTTDGVVIKAPMGQPVYAIANGVVIFSKWLPGYGLLMIVNHGHGYMTLYGRNQELLYHNGQTIHKGDMIAKVGNTGGFTYSGLYFGIRHHGQAVNPKLWCH